MINKILLVDDDISTNLYHRIILEESGLVNEIVDCLTVDDAISILKSVGSAPDIIFLDINMPMKNGWDFLNEYKELPQHHKAQQIVILSTTRIPSDLERANNSPLVSQFLLKPLSVDKLKRLIK
ncbi:MAG: response regulator [Bacteroidota bacterium]